MNRDVAVAKATRWRPLPSAAIGHLAHDLRGCIHVIRGHAELLLLAEGADEQSRQSASYVVDASRVLGSLCEDVIDVLHLPEVRPAEPVLLALDALAVSLSMLAVEQGIKLHIVESGDEENAIRVHPAVCRVVTNVLEHAVRNAATDATLSGGSRSPALYAIAVAPVLVNLAECDGVIALVTELLAAHGGELSVCGGRMELLVPIMSEAH